MGSRVFTQGVLFMGRPGIPMLEEAEGIAKAVLSTDNLSTHPSYLYVTHADGKKGMGVEEADQIVRFASETPILSDKRAIVVDGIDQMTEAGQNKLLKTLEDKSDAVVIAIAYGERVLDTVKSRMTVYNRRELTMERFMEVLPKEYQDDAEFYYRITRGCPGMVDEIKPYIPMFKEAYAHILERKFHMVLSDFSLVKEKDKGAITATGYVGQAVSAIEAAVVFDLERSVTGSSAYTTDQLNRMITIVTNEKSHQLSSAHSKDDFFRFLMELIEIAEERSVK